MSNRQKRRNPHAYKYVDRPSSNKRHRNRQYRNRNDSNYVILQRDPFEIVMGLCVVAFIALVIFFA
ncbi:hypothetical protein [Neisseria subflava]|uniref:hypothetical protein n=1 Tax=Neisseria subflava TaxID=28449 RepID=UPI002029CB99|nr:hypothetical protein [Neisseria subflava]MCL9778029.1 hypothetical protein [Neisseria subflava]